MIRRSKYVVALVALGIALTALATSPTIKGSYPYFDLTAFNGIATGSLPSCASGVAAGEGWVAYDSTTKTMKFCNGTSWGAMGADLSSVGSSILPSADATYDLGSGAKRWNILFGSTARVTSLSDTAGQTRMNISSSQASTYNSMEGTGAGGMQHRFFSSGVVAGDDRWVAAFFRSADVTNGVSRIDANGNYRHYATDFAAPFVHGTAATTAKDIEVGSGAMTAGELAVTFSTAFGGNPVCVCTHVNTTNTNSCNIKSAAVPTTSGVTFAVASGGTDVVHWHCIGAR